MSTEQDLKESARRQVEAALKGESALPLAPHLASPRGSSLTTAAVPPSRCQLETDPGPLPSSPRLSPCSLAANTGSSSSAGTTGLQQQQQHVIPSVPPPPPTLRFPLSLPTHVAHPTRSPPPSDKSTALPTNSLINETQQLSDRGTTGLGGSSVQTVGNTSASFTPKTTSDTTPSSAAAGTTGSAPLLSDQIPADVKQAAATASQAVASQVEVAKQGLDHAFNKSDAITPGNELPGGWGPTPPATTTGPHATTTIYQDISTALDKVGQAAYNAVPASLIEKLHASPAGSPVKTTTTASPITTTTNTVPHQAGGAGQAHPTTAEDIGAAVKDGVAAAQVNVKAAADKAVELGKNAYSASDPFRILLSVPVADVFRPPARLDPCDPVGRPLSRRARDGAVDDDERPLDQQTADACADHSPVARRHVRLVARDDRDPVAGRHQAGGRPPR